VLHFPPTQEEHDGKEFRVCFRGAVLPDEYRPFYDDMVGTHAFCVWVIDCCVTSLLLFGDLIIICDAGKKYRVPGFLSTSFSFAVADEYLTRQFVNTNRPAVLFKVLLDARGADDRRCVSLHCFVFGD
jgi:hypothetical protein